MPSKTHNIVRAAASDAQAIRQLQHRTWIDTYVDDTPGITKEDINSRDFTSERKINRMRRKLVSTNWGCLVAKSDELVVGVVLVNKPKNFIDILYVDPDHQGQGLGRKLFECGITELDRSRDIKLNVAIHNKRAISFYKSFGFIVSGRVKHTKPTFPTGKDIPQQTMILGASVS